MNYFVFDIETVPNERAAKYLEQAKYEAPSNYKDQDKIAAYIENAKKKDLEKAALYWWTGRIVAIGYRSTFMSCAFTIMGKDEADLIKCFFGVLCAEEKRSLCENFFPIGKNSKNFDIPYIIARAMYHDLGIPACLKQRRGLSDIDEIFGTSSSSQKGSLADYAFGLNLDGKLGSGEMVKDWFADEDEGWNKIKAYCSQDVEITHEIISRYDKTFSI